MSKLRPVRFKNMSVDMTAMCDVTFLLLCFFVLTARFQQWVPMNITPPVAQSNRYCKFSDSDIGIIYIADDRIMYQIVGDSIRKQTLKQMGQMYNVTFSTDETEAFINAPIIGAPIAYLKQYDKQYPNWENPLRTPGIPYDKDSNELFNWIRESRKADVLLNGRALLLQIKADKDVSYAIIKQAIATLKKQKVYHFELLTSKEVPEYFQ